MSNNFNFKEFFHCYEKNSTSDDIQRYCILWKSVIAQAVIDVTSNCKKTESLVEKRKAISWLSDFSRDFVYTCILADCDPAYVKNKIQPILENLTKKSDKTFMHT
ncbi:hypothetical protein HET73_01010 [Wolbachia endosymbiont of Atemnus politus]|uniref:hypothetical protein n=1 Tax=Wolbachia endosymbiont of Atemnus politus TaxID=2682840 RepID=UPI0015719F6E|nr:hypothetical protein [Wolbachia endosymbiont of Atemnus politus]NSM56242.1 hypothetical protein [Wolbachia endosymbiont of Atemnus politus]NSX83013.1 hypothetical protein [Wolbachia endosymbiont of Atemnus politus]